MNCRAKISLITLAIISVLSLQAEGTDWQAFNSQTIEIEAHSSGEGRVLSTYPPFMQTFYAKIFDWEPEKASKPECKLNFDNQMLRVRKMEFQEFYKENFTCAANARFRDSGINTKIMRNFSVRFDLSDTEHFRKVDFKLPRNGGGSVDVRGLFGSHDATNPRPLVIFRMGVHGSVDEVVA